jgi:hypothetical protein
MEASNRQGRYFVKVRMMVTVELKNGNVYRFRINETEDNISSVLASIDRVWQGSKEDGFVSFNGTYIRISEVIKYGYRKLIFGLF